MIRDETSAVAYCQSLTADLPSLSSVSSAIRLSGGLVNYVFRISPVPAFAGQETLILKHYAPFLARHNEVAFSQARYHVEKEALKLVHGVLNGNSRVKVPRVFHEDDQRHVLIMEDAGSDVVSLLDAFKISCKKFDWDSDAVSRLADQISFLTKTLSGIVASELSPIFENAALWKILNEFVYPSLGPKAIESQVSELEKLVATCTPYLPPKPDDPSRCFVMGDLWPSSILIDPHSGNIWVIDWECARFADVTSDMSHLCANLWVMEHNPDVFQAGPLRTLQAKSFSVIFPSPAVFLSCLSLVTAHCTHS
mmetsp:Transcript_801/g.1421  ORF Transcript_801/g.1421 Transcript_801/m.1421 type:complete len:309 (-) Transcript_801:91-1017(-)